MKNKFRWFLVFLLLMFFYSCSYHLVKLSEYNIYLREVKTEVSFLAGIESEITQALLRNLGRRGVRFKMGCPEVIVDLLSVGPADYFYKPSGVIAKIKGFAKYRVTVTSCNGKSLNRNISIPVSYTYYSEPGRTESSIKSSIIDGVDELSEKIMEMLNGAGLSNK